MTRAHFWVDFFPQLYYARDILLNLTSFFFFVGAKVYDRRDGMKIKARKIIIQGISVRKCDKKNLKGLHRMSSRETFINIEMIMFTLISRCCKKENGAESKAKT